MRGPEVSFGANVIASNTTDDGVNVASSNPDEEVDIFEHIRQKDEATEKGKKCRKIKKREAKRVRITCLKQMGNMKEYPLVDLSLFTWVFGEVDTHTSIFLTTKFIIDLKERVKLTYDNNSDWVVVDHCLPSERVYLNTHKGQPNFIYLCEDMSKDLNITFLFFDFECVVLSEMNVAPTQLHPNSWAFLKAFSTLFCYLNIIPTNNTFFFILLGESE